MNKKRCLFLIPILFFFLQSLAIPFGYKAIPVYYIVSGICTVILFVFYKKYTFRRLKYLYRKTPFKYFIYFNIWIIIDSFLMTVVKNNSFLLFLYYIIALVLLTFIPGILNPALIVPKFVSRKGFIKFLMIIYYLMCVIGLIQYIGLVYNVSVINIFISCLNNIRFLSIDNFQFSEGRLTGVFDEPGWFGAFVFLNLPILYKICLCKYSIFKNKLLNITIKSALIPLFWICLILTKSPIWLIFCSILTIVYFLPGIKTVLYKKRYIILFIISLLGSVVYCLIMCNAINFDSIRQSYLNRIFITFTTINNWETFTKIENSLATRIICTYSAFTLWLKNFLFGVGLGNARFYMLDEIMNNFVVVTDEINYKIMLSTQYKKGIFNIGAAMFFELATETGLTGLSLFYIFLYKLYKYTGKLILFYTGLNKLFLRGVQNSILALSCILWYDISTTRLIIWLLLGIPFMFSVEYAKCYINKNEEKG